MKKKRGDNINKVDTDSDEVEASSESDSDESISSDDISDDNISDSDFIPDSEDERNAEKNDTINISSGGESPIKVGSKDAAQTFDPNSKEFWDKVEEMRKKGFSSQQTNKLKEQGEGDSRPSDKSALNLPLPLRPKNGINHSKVAAFTQLYINFEHEKRCLKNCQGSHLPAQQAGRNHGHFRFVPGHDQRG